MSRPRSSNDLVVAERAGQALRKMGPAEAGFCTSVGQDQIAHVVAAMSKALLGAKAEAEDA